MKNGKQWVYSTDWNYDSPNTTDLLKKSKWEMSKAEKKGNKAR